MHLRVCEINQEYHTRHRIPCGADTQDTRLYQFLVLDARPDLHVRLQNNLPTCMGFGRRTINQGI